MDKKNCCSVWESNGRHKDTVWKNAECRTARAVDDKGLCEVWHV